MQIKENKCHTGQTKVEILEGDAFKNPTLDENCRKARCEC